MPAATRRSRALNQPNGPAPTQSQSAPPSSAPSKSPDIVQLHQTASKAHPKNPLHQQWQFAAVWEFLYQFHKGLKSPYYENIEEFARDLSSPSGTPMLYDVQIGLLKNVSSQRGLTIDMFDDYTRRQFINRRVSTNPFGTGPTPLSFYSFSPELRVLVLHQLVMWIVSNTDTFRNKIDPHKVMDHTDWRIDPVGWDAKGNTYYQFDNGYLYCRAEPLPPVYQKWKSRKSTVSKSKRRKVATEDEDEQEPNSPLPNENEIFLSRIEWKCICSNLEEYRALVARFDNSKHPDEKELRKVIIQDIMPALEKEEQRRRKKLLEEEKELARLELLSGRKRSARVDERMAKRREAEEHEQKRRREQEEHDRQAKEDLQRQKDEEARIAKLEEREKRLQEREFRAKQRAEERARLLDPDATESDDNDKGRKSSRQKEKRKAELDMEDSDWVFDCICGVNGLNYDDGTYSIACDKCGVWQHTECLNVPAHTAEESEFICDRCRDKELAAQKGPIKLKLRLTARSPSQEAGGDEAAPNHPSNNNDITGAQPAGRSIESHTKPEDTMTLQEKTQSDKTTLDATIQIPPLSTSGKLDPAPATREPTSPPQTALDLAHPS
ncbi:hypothetical protein TWF730_008168 [Orbilia blumenaviensis]|uniref:Zinc finger PHD-type domain-containing protein n=1 Tax=Orbilia blumenaviensis TaxID=1796055 RepID=A0AAV9V3U9_9PEZI